MTAAASSPADPATDRSGPDLSPYVPTLAVELAASGVPAARRVDGSMLSADISGFTALSERLAGKGKAGAEEITELINVCFTALIEAAYRFGGEVLKFGGDALLVLFRGDHHERRAADAGLAMQRALSDTTTARRAHLSMTVGVAEGPFDVFVVGSGYRELLIAGAQASEVIRLEGEAAQGTTLVSPGIADRLPTSMRAGERAGGIVVEGATGDAATGPRLRPLLGVDLRPYVPGAVVDQLVAFANLGGEHRLVTVGFVMVAGVAELVATGGLAAAAVALGEVVDDVVGACDRFGVTALHTDIAPDGVKFVLCAGAPVNPGDTADALLRAALQIASSSSTLTIRQGVQTGRVFAGFLGSDIRRTYTLMGDPVNTAARMLGKADDRGIVAVEAVVGDTRAVFDTEPLAPFHVKGKSDPISAHRVLGMTDRIRRDSAGTPLIGRHRELEVLTRTVGRLDVVVELVGAAGVGKSRLLDAAWDASEGIAIHQAACTPYGAASPFSLFRPLLRGGTGIDLTADPDTAGDRLRDIVADADADLLPMLPLLAVPFGARVAPTPEVDALSPEFRRERLHRAVLDFVDAAASRPLLLVAEDVHWIDDASGELLNYLVGASAGRPWAAIVTRRDEGSFRIEPADHVVTLHLDPLAPDDVRELAIEVSRRPLSDSELALIVGRAGGNPLFALELVRAMERTGTASIPDSIEQLVVERLDHLPPEVRRVLRVAAVLGNPFDAHEARLVVEADSAGTIEPAHLEEAERQHFIQRIDDDRWSFIHALHREAAYEALPFRRRRELHRLAARIIERRPSDPAAIAPLLSLHYASAGDHRAALEHSLVAGRLAEEQHATADAAVAYERALDASRHLRPSDRAQRADLAARLGDLYFVLARFGDAGRAFATARRLNDDPVREVELMRRLGELKEREGRAAAGLRWYARAADRIASQPRTPRTLSARAEVVLAEASLRHRLGDDARCVELAREALRDAELAGDDRSVALALERIHVGSVHLRDHAAESGLRALAVHRRLGDQSGVIRTLINLGAQAYFAGAWTQASDYYVEAAELSYGAGNLVFGATASLNAAEILCDQGRWRAATRMFDDAGRNFAAVGYPIGVAAAELYASVAAMRSGSLDTAMAQLSAARAKLDDIGAGDLLDDLETREIELALTRGEPVVDRCARLSERLGATHALAPRLGWQRGLATLLAGDPVAAVASLDEALELSTDADFDRALTITLMLHIDPPAPSRADRIDERDALVERLGIVELPPVVASAPLRRHGS